MGLVDLGVTAATPFIINDQDRMVGAQPLAVFRDRLTLYVKQF
jgi:hypothetical protein